MKRILLTGGVAALALALGNPAAAEGDDKDQGMQPTQSGTRNSTGEGATGSRNSTANQDAAADRTGNQRRNQRAGDQGAFGAADASGQSQRAQLSVSQIKQAQQVLKDMGEYEGQVDGIVGPLTHAAVSSFQEQRGLPQTGHLDSRTLQALNVSAGAGERQPVAGTEGDESGTVWGTSGVETQQMQEYQLANLESQAVRTLQTRLQELGHYRGVIDGIVGPKTRAALRQFAAAQLRLVSQGKVNEVILGAFDLSPDQINPTGQEQGQGTEGQRQPVRGEEQRDQPEGQEQSDQY